VLHMDSTQACIIGADFLLIIWCQRNKHDRHLIMIC